MAFLRLTPPFLASKNRVTKQMLQVVLALIPAITALVYFFGPGVIITAMLAIVTALLAETVMLTLRKRPIKPFITDGSAVVTAILLAVAIPPLSPWWLTVIGVLFAIVFAKHLYGGLGYNPFNPAMTAYVLLLISFPLEMSTWPAIAELRQLPIDLASAWQHIFHYSIINADAIDAFSGATPLDSMKTQLGLQFALSIIMQQPLFGSIAGHGWQWVNIWFALGGLFLLYRRIISWHIPVAMLAALTIISMITWSIAPDAHASPLFHLLSGGTMIGAFFIATDPVTAATTVKGRLVFGAGVGLLTYIIRVWGGYPDGIAFAVILMNMLVPLIDYYTQPRVYGSSKS